MDVEAPSPQTTLLILLGASAWPLMPEFQPSEAFANAARRLKAYFLNPRPFGLPAENLLDLFDSEKSADELDLAIGQFLEQRLLTMKAAGNAGRDLLLYFIGHGGFVGRDSEFYLAIRRTRMDSPRASGMQMISLAETLTERARHLRRIIILDCCFAAAAFSAFQAGPDQVALEKTVDAFQAGRKAEGFPTKGTALLCSSNHKSPSLLLPDGSSTMFTKAFLDALIQGTPSQQNRFTLRDVKDVATDFLSEIRNAPKPVVHSPDQSEGDVADVPFFPNPRAEEERRRQAEEQARRIEEERVRKAKEEEHVRRAEEERRRQTEVEERTRRMEEERQRRVEKEQTRQAEKERERKATEEQTLRAREESHRQAFEPTSQLPRSTNAMTQLSPAQPPTELITPPSGQSSTTASSDVDSPVQMIQQRRLPTRRTMLLSGLTVAVILILVLMGSLVLPFLLGVRGGTSTPILNATTVSRLVKKWAFQTGNNVASSPTVVNGIVYVGSYDHNLYAFALPETSP